MSTALVKQPKTEMGAFLRLIEEIGGSKEVYAYVSAGYTLPMVARRYGMPLYLLQTWANLPEHAAHIAIARKLAATAHVENALDILDELAEAADIREVTPSEVKIAEARVKQRNFLASHHNKEQYGPRGKSTSVDVNVGGNLLNTLRKNSTPMEAEIVDVECKA